MGSNERDLEWFLQRTPERSDVHPEEFTPDDWNRRSREAFIAQATGSARTLHSQGNMRMHGTGVQQHSVELSHVGQIATTWQRAVSATGAALEQVKSLRGSLPADIIERTRLMLNAAPMPGSIVLHLEPKPEPMTEAEPNGNIAMFNPPRPLADRASETLINLLSDVATAELDEANDLATSLRDLGPRVAGSLTQLAQAIHKSDITLDISWSEPEAAITRASINPVQAMWVRDFVSGRGLDAVNERVQGVLRTVSDRERWLVELSGDEFVKMDASQLTPAQVERVHVGSGVTLDVRVSIREQPDGTIRRSYMILNISD